MANTASAAKLVDECVTEIACLHTTPDARMELLEVLRPAVHYLATRLDRAALAPSQQSDDLGNLAQHLQNCLCEGYNAVVRDVLQNQSAQRGLNKDLLAKAIHRSISDFSRQLLRTLQLYVSAPPDIWLTMNQLYLLAEQMEIAGTRLPDPENHHELALSVTDVYMRQLLLSCCRPNQLRHRHLSRIFNALEQWVSRVFLEAPNPDALFRIDLMSDHGPIYSTLNRPCTEPRSIRTDVLVYELEAYLRDIDSSIPIPDFIDNELLSQLIGAWGKITERSHRRTPSDTELLVSVGLRNVHFFLSGGVVFSEQVTDTDALLRREINPFLDTLDQSPSSPGAERSNGDVWENAFDLRVRIPQNPNVANPEKILLTGQLKGGPDERQPAITEGFAESDSVSLYRYHRTRTVDTSPSGYRIRWPERLPPNLKTGELVAVREASDQRWCIAVVRWIQQEAGQATTTGIELISPRAIPIAARVVQKRGGPTDYARALLLPEIKAISQEAMLITPKVPFATEQKVHLQRQGIQNTAQLRSCVEATESFNQFTFRMLDGYLENPGARRTMSDLAGIVIEPGR
ncbi:MAG: hypothetical protein AAGG11_23525 [Pseudomonadota bacterium]